MPPGQWGTYRSYIGSRRKASMIKINATLILTVFNFVLLVAVLTVILWKPMLKFLDERMQKIKESLKLAEDNTRRAEEMKAEHDEIIKLARKKANELVDTAMATASNESRDIIAHAREQAHATIESAREEIEMEAERIKRDLRRDVAEMTVSLSGKILEREIKEDDHRDLINRSLDAFE